MSCYLKKSIVFATTLIFLSVVACRRRGNEPAVIEDLGIALQTIRHQVEDSMSVRRPPINKTVVESTERKTEVEIKSIEFASKSNCEVKTGSFVVTVTSKVSGVSQKYHAEFVDKKSVKLRNLTMDDETKVYQIGAICPK